MTLLRGEAAAQALEALAADPAALIAIACDPASLNGATLELLAFASDHAAVVIDVAGTPQLKTYLTGNTRPFAGYDAKSIQRAMLRRFGSGPSRWACIKVSEQLLLGGRDAALSVDAIASRHGMPPFPDATSGVVQLKQSAQAALALVRRQADALNRDGMREVSRIEAQALAAVAEMEHRGMPFDAALWQRLAAQTEREKQAAAASLHSLLGPSADGNLLGDQEVDLDSDAALLRALADKGHPVANARRSTLQALPAPLGPLLGRYRSLNKLANTYGLSFLKYVGADGRIRPSFSQIGASTGRMACASPNLQAMVKDASHRGCFQAMPGRLLVAGDYAACELRILAEMSQDPVFAEAFERGEDVHARVAQSMFNTEVSKTIRPELRQRAKSINFGLCYGMGADGLARTVGVNRAEAQALLSRYFRTFPRIGSYLTQAAADAVARGYASTLSGRRLYMDSLGEGSDAGAAGRVGKNMPIQGTSADAIKLALALTHQRLGEGAFLVNCVHDEIVVECSADAASKVAEIMRQAMQEAGRRLVPTIGLVAEVTASRAWDM